MKNAIEFKFTEKSVRVEMDEHNNPWFCATDVCSILGYSNAPQAITKNCLEKGVSKRYTLTEGGKQELTFINEGNLYRLIIKSRKPEAEKFESWVCDEVLPAIRKTGTYSMPEYTAEKSTYESITPDQLRQINQVVHEIMTCCHFAEKANYNTFSGIREQYGLKSINDLPSMHFEKVFGTLHVLREKATEYLKLRCKIDELFIKEVLRYHQLQIQIQADLFLQK